MAFLRPSNDVSVKKESIVKKLFKMVSPRPKKQDTFTFDEDSKFSYFFDDVSEDNPAYETLPDVIGLCDEAYRIAKLRLSMADKIRTLNEQLSELDCFNELTEEDANHFKDLIERFTSLATESNQLMYQITSFDQAIQYMSRLEKDATTYMDNIQDAERRQRILKHDISYLEGEKSDLGFEKEVLEKGLVFIYRFSMAMIGVFGLATIILAFLFLFEGIPIFYPTTIFIIAIMIFISVIYFFRRRVEYELQINIKKQKRAVAFLNKKNAVYAHYTNYLRFVYKKYKVKNSTMLEKNLKDFTNYKHLTLRYDSIRSILFQTEHEIEVFLREKSLTTIKTSTEKFAKTIDIDNKKDFYNEIRDSRNQIEDSLSQLDSRHEEIWDLLVIFAETDPSSEKIVDKIIRAYIDEVGKIFQMLDTRVQVE